jgi:hypothetical protein
MLELNKPNTINPIFKVDLSEFMEREPVLTDETRLAIERACYDQSAKNMNQLYESSPEQSIPSTNISIDQFRNGEGQTPLLHYNHPMSPDTIKQNRYATEFPAGAHRVHALFQSTNIPCLQSIINGGCLQYYPTKCEQRTSPGT